MNHLHKHDCTCGGCETPVERMQREAGLPRDAMLGMRAFGEHRDHAAKVHAGYCYECQVWLAR